MTDIAGLLTDHPFTRDFRPDHVARLAAMSGELYFEPGDLIFREGDQSSVFYLLISGNVALEVVPSGRPVRVATLYAGDALGWSSLTRDHDKQFRARAIEPVRALAIDGARLRHACEDDYSFGFWIMRAVVNIVSARLHAMRAQLLDVYSPAGV